MKERFLTNVVRVNLLQKESFVEKYSEVVSGKNDPFFVVKLKGMEGFLEDEHNEIRWIWITG